MRLVARPRGFTLIETIIALLVFSVGALALAGTGALVGRELRVDDLRERSTRIAASRLETLRAGCHDATSGTEVIGAVRSQWSITGEHTSRIAVTESVSYTSWNGQRADTYKAVFQCG